MSEVSIGVDGWRGGWVAVALRDGHFDTAQLFTGFADILEAFSNASAIGIDIPIGLPEDRPRPADQLARAFIGGGGSSVFPVPTRAALLADDHASASRMHFSLTGRGLSQQSYALRKKILEVDALVRADDIVIEVHPEVSFRALADSPVGYSKKTWNGAARRRSLLTDAGIVIPDDLGPAGQAPGDDILDAAVASWTAHRYAIGEARSLPEDPPRDARGRPVAIWY